MNQILSKPCSQCKIEQPLTEFCQYKTGPRAGRYWSQCKSCRYAYLRDWRKKNPEEWKQHYRKGKYKWLYGLDMKDLIEFGKCPICLKEKKLIVDHDHKEGLGQYRGFICMNCNTLLGHIENPEKMARVKSYLKIESI